MKRASRIKRQKPPVLATGNSLRVVNRTLRYFKDDPYLTMIPCEGAATGCYTLISVLSSDRSCRRCRVENAQRAGRKKDKRERPGKRMDIAEVIGKEKRRERG